MVYGPMVCDPWNWCCFFVEKAKLAAESSKIAEESISHYQSSNLLNKDQQTTTKHHISGPREERLQPLGASDPKQYHDQEGTDINNNNNTKGIQHYPKYYTINCINLGWGENQRCKLFDSHWNLYLWQSIVFYKWMKINVRLVYSVRINGKSKTNEWIKWKSISRRLTCRSFCAIHNLTVGIVCFVWQPIINICLP